MPSHWHKAEKPPFCMNTVLVCKNKTHNFRQSATWRKPNISGLTTHLLVNARGCCVGLCKLLFPITATKRSAVCLPKYNRQSYNEFISYFIFPVMQANIQLRKLLFSKCILYEHRHFPLKSHRVRLMTSI